MYPVFHCSSSFPTTEKDARLLYVSVFHTCWLCRLKKMIIQARTDHEETPMTGYSLFLFVDIQSPESWQTEVTEVGHILLGKFLFRCRQQKVSVHRKRSTVRGRKWSSWALGCGCWLESLQRYQVRVRWLLNVSYSYSLCASKDSQKRVGFCVSYFFWKVYSC